MQKCLPDANFSPPLCRQRSIIVRFPPTSPILSTKLASFVRIGGNHTRNIRKFVVFHEKGLFPPYFTCFRARNADFMSLRTT
jgi:hypothetical protein